MNLPSSTATSTSESPDTAAGAISPEMCGACKSQDSWVIHSARLRGVLRFYCTHCLLRNHPASFCPTCFAFYDSSPPHQSRRVSCSDCSSVTHIHCAGDAKSPPYRCPPCRDPDGFSFFRPIVDENGARCMDKALSEAFLCAAKIAASSMSKAVTFYRSEAERKGKDAAVAKKRAREALEDVLKLDEKAKLAVSKPSVDHLSGNRDQKPKQSPASNGGLKQIESSATAQVKKQSPSVVQVKQEK
ncbi:unnamed protein product [Brassica oleracea var. botrytis]|uniref:Uncharacterized protein n=2 Tax=Brassica TaxID=3705 RepID=A0A3P6FG02_BRAOL|nr:uncharacterized protein BNAC05G07070D [Brassica napus]KAH0877004.1 hypothetical protein HID58_064398 [Brassica napus]CAF1924435.1 unnamed protein product [Brassica napus]VDD41959.1 unnamed protein product [Brassica oleracea]